MNENEAKKTISKLDRELEIFDRTYEEARWFKNQGLLSASDQSSLEGRRAEIYLNPRIQDIVKEFIETAQDPVFRRILIVLDRLIKYAKVESNQSVYDIRSRIEQTNVNYPIFIAGKRVNRTDIRNILRSERDSKLRQEALHCYDELSRLVEKDVNELIIQRNLIAQAMGFHHFGELGLEVQGLSREKINHWFTEIIQSSEAIYREFLGVSAAKLHQPHLNAYDLSYAITQFYTLPDQYYLREKLTEALFWLAQKINLSEAVSRVRFDYVDIPFQGICVTIHVPDDIRILINPANGHTFYITYFHEVGHAMHSAHMTQPYHLFRDEPGPFCEGMAQSMARFVDNPEWLSSLAKLPINLLEKFKQFWRTYNIYHLRLLITQAEFEWQMYAAPDINHLKTFQAIYHQYLNTPSDDLRDWADNIYWASYPFYVQNYVVAEMIASQTHTKLRQTFGISIHPECGTWFKDNYWNPGGSEEWSEKILASTGKPFSADELINELVKGYPAD